MPCTWTTQSRTHTCLQSQVSWSLPFQVNHYNGFIDQYSPSGDALTMEEVCAHLLQQTSVEHNKCAPQWQRPAARVFLCDSPCVLSHESQLAVQYCSGRTP